MKAEAVMDFTGRMAQSIRASRLLCRCNGNASEVGVYNGGKGKSVRSFRVFFLMCLGYCVSVASTLDVRDYIRDPRSDG